MAIPRKINLNNQNNNTSNNTGNKKALSEEEYLKKVSKLRKTQKWINYYNNLRPRDSKGNMKPFPKVTNSKGMCEADFKKYIDKMVLIEIDQNNLGSGFDDFYNSFKKEKI